VIPRLEQRHRQRQDCRHAGSRRDAGLGPFHGGEPVLQHAHGRIREAGVDEAFFAAGKARRGLLRAVEHEARREKQSLGMLAKFAAQLPGTHTQRRKLE
jgi:hypothetical protein